MTNDLAALVSSRICHDLISPIGAINNGVELLQMTNSAPTEELQLISDSADNASAKVQFFRIAYGRASRGQMMQASEIREVLKKVSESGRFSYEWNSQSSLARQDAQLIFLTLQCAESSVPSGGNIKIVQADDRWKITATGSHIQLDEDLWDEVIEPDPARSFNSAQVQFALLPLLLKETGRNLEYDCGHDNLTIRF